MSSKVPLKTREACIVTASLPTFSHLKNLRWKVRTEAKLVIAGSRLLGDQTVRVSLR
jgi:hypothetical protein